jgi:capsule polysaccharide export protein KpsE/RkpR
MLRQQEYLASVVEPGQPDKARYPFRVLWTGSVLLAGLTILVLFQPTGQQPDRSRRRRE